MKVILSNDDTATCIVVALCVGHLAGREMQGMCLKTTMKVSDSATEEGIFFFFNLRREPSLGQYKSWLKKSHCDASP